MKITALLAALLLTGCATFDGGSVGNRKNDLNGFRSEEALKEFNRLVNSTYVPRNAKIER